jgi:hypothetical protein
MKARFYRGPWDGKVKDLDPSMTRIVVAHPPKMSFFDELMEPSMPMVIKKTMYTRTNHTHPDGSVFYEWDQKKGTKI